MSIMPIPLLLVTGALGAGKTRLFQRIAPFTPFDQALIIVNEFSDTTIDNRLMHNQRGAAKPLAGGCVCCTSRHELLTTVQMALALDAPPQSIVIETTGLASPQPILAALIGNQALAARLDVRVISVVDATALSRAMGAPNIREHWALADAIILTKTDLIADKSLVAGLHTAIATVNPLAKIVHAADQDDAALAVFLASLNRLETFGDGLSWPLPRDHIGTIGSIVLRHKVPMAFSTLEAFLFALSRALGPDVMRLKGFVNITGRDDAQLLAQMVQGVVSPPEWIKTDDDRQTEIVVIAEHGVLHKAERLFAGIVQGLASDTPDAEALNHNPLSIAGF